MFEIKFLKDCENFEFSSFLDREIKDLCLDDSVETLALVSDGVVYDYGASVEYSDLDCHRLIVSNDSMNHFRIFFGNLFLYEYLNLDCLNNFFHSFVKEL